MAKPKIKTDGRTITVRVPISIRKRGGRKVVLTPDGVEADRRELRGQQVDNAMVKALARAFRWRGMLEKGRHATIKEIANAEAINESYIARVVRLTLLAPEIVEAILEGRQPAETTLLLLMRSFPLSWAQQRGDLLKQDLRSRAVVRNRVDRSSGQLQRRRQRAPCRGDQPPGGRPGPRLRDQR